MKLLLLTLILYMGIMGWREGQGTKTVYRPKINFGHFEAPKTAILTI